MICDVIMNGTNYCECVLSEYFEKMVVEMVVLGSVMFFFRSKCLPQNTIFMICHLMILIF